MRSRRPARPTQLPRRPRWQASSRRTTSAASTRPDRRDDRAQGRAAPSARPRRRRPRPRRQPRGGLARHAPLFGAARAGLIEGLTAGGPRRRRHRPRHHADELLRHRPPEDRRRRAGHRLAQPGGVQRPQVHQARGAAGLRRPRHPAARDGGRDRQLPRRRPAGAVSSGRTSPPRTASTSSPSSAGPRPDARRLKVVVDAANGMAVVDRAIWDALGVDLVPLFFELDGTFPNHEANPLKLENLRDLQAMVNERPAPTSASPATATSTAPPSSTRRASRSAATSPTALIAGELLAHEPGKHVLYDLRSSRAVAEYIREQGGVPVRERVGHSFMKATLRERHGIFGGELAGHYYFRDNYLRRLRHARGDRGPQPALALGQDDVARLVAPLARYAKSPETNFEVEDKAAKMNELAARLRRRPDRLARRHHRAVPRLVVQRPPLEHRAAPAPGRARRAPPAGSPPLGRAGRPDRAPGRPLVRSFVGGALRHSGSKAGSYLRRGRPLWIPSARAP